MSNNLKDRLHTIVFEADTKEGKLFDVILLYTIVISIIIVIIDSVPRISSKYHDILIIVEWSITIFFTLEYLLRIWMVNKPWKYALSFMGLVDLLSILPTYFSLFMEGSEYLIVIRAMRLMRVFRILKLSRFLGETETFANALNRSRYKITVFLIFTCIIVTIVGTLMYLIEGPKNGFENIPHSIYWAIVTLTTVGYGDISPATPLGQFIASLIMLLGYGIIAVPTGIVTAELVQSEKNISTQTCPNCSIEGHKFGAEYCFDCGHKL